MREYNPYQHIYVPKYINIGAPKYINQIWTDIKGYSRSRGFQHFIDING